MWEKLPVGGFKWVKNTSQFCKGFTENYNVVSDEVYFLEVHVQYSEKFYDLYNNLSFLPKRRKLKKLENL